MVKVNCKLYTNKHFHIKYYFFFFCVRLRLGRGVLSIFGSSSPNKRLFLLQLPRTGSRPLISVPLEQQHYGGIVVGWGFRSFHLEPFVYQNSFQGGPEISSHSTHIVSDPNLLAVIVDTLLFRQMTSLQNQRKPVNLLPLLKQ